LFTFPPVYWKLNSLIPFKPVTQLLLLSFHFILYKNGIKSRFLLNLKSDLILNGKNMISNTEIKFPHSCYWLFCLSHVTFASLKLHARKDNFVTATVGFIVSSKEQIQIVDCQKVKMCLTHALHQFWICQFLTVDNFLEFTRASLLNFFIFILLSWEVRKTETEAETLEMQNIKCKMQMTKCRNWNKSCWQSQSHKNSDFALISIKGPLNP
jgi:hypothetical protein